MKKQKPAPLKRIEELGSLLRKKTTITIKEFEEIEKMFGKTWMTTQRYIERLLISREQTRKDRDLWKTKYEELKNENTNR